MPSQTSSSIPVRTALGQEELRQRRGELGQRHRTILFMVDGRRELAEVLSLAHQAGASTTHFEDLVRHGLVELPRPPEPAAVPAAPELSEAAIEAFEAEADGHLARVEVVELPLARPLPAPEAAPAPPASALPRREPTFDPQPPALPPGVPPEPAPPPVVVAPQPVEPPRRQRFRLSRGLKPAAPPDASERFVPPIAAPNLVEDEAVLAEVRAHLLDALRLDPPSYASRLPTRVRQANDSQALIDLIWEMEREPGHPRRSHRGKARLHDARELLGMGNTQVAEDSRSNITEF